MRHYAHTYTIHDFAVVVKSYFEALKPLRVADEIRLLIIAAFDIPILLLIYVSFLSSSPVRTRFIAVVLFSDCEASRSVLFTRLIRNAAR